MADGLTPESGKVFPNLPGASTSQNSPAPADASKNVFTELFGKDISQKDSGMMNAVASQQEKKTSFFGAKPKAPELTLKKLSDHPSRPGAAMLKASFFVLLLTIAGFLTQNSTLFSFIGSNPALRAEQAQEQVNELKADVRVKNHLAAAMLLDQYVTKADEYFYNQAQATSPYSSENSRARYEARVETLEPELKDLLEQIQTYLAEDIPDTELVTALTLADQTMTDLRAKEGTVDASTLLQDLQDLQTAKTLMQNPEFKALMRNVVVEEATLDQLEAIYEAFGNLNSSVTALISKIKNNREEWSFYVDEIESLTRDVYPLFNTEFQESLLIDSIRMNSDKTITVSGRTSTEDTKNFTLVSNLIDTYEESEYFMDVEDRSYVKNESDEIYTGNFRINMTIEQ